MCPCRKPIHSTVAEGLDIRHSRWWVTGLYVLCRPAVILPLPFPLPLEGSLDTPPLPRTTVPLHICVFALHGALPVFWCPFARTPLFLPVLSISPHRQSGVGSLTDAADTPDTDCGCSLE